MGQAGLKQKTGLAMPALIIGANLPDVDVGCFFWLEGTEHLAFRRGITHGPPALVLLPLILAGLLWGWDRWQTKRGTRPEGRLPVSFGWLFGLSFLGCLTHPAMDWLNVYGIRLLEPFSSQWFYGDTLFIIDPWLWAVMIAAVWVSRRREKAGAVSWARPAQVGLAAMLVYIGANGFVSATHGYHSAGHQKGATEIVSPLPVLPFAREEISGRQNVWFHLDESGEKWVHFVKPEDRCAFPDFTAARRTNSQLDAFLFWSRAPFLTRAADGSVVLRDARFTDPRVGDRFSLALLDVKCEELPKP